MTASVQLIITSFACKLNLIRLSSPEAVCFQYVLEIKSQKIIQFLDLISVPHIIG